MLQIPLGHDGELQFPHVDVLGGNGDAQVDAPGPGAFQGFLKGPVVAVGVHHGTRRIHGSVVEDAGKGLHRGPATSFAQNHGPDDRLIHFDARCPARHRVTSLFTGWLR